MQQKVMTGLDHFLLHPPDNIRGRRLGLLCNPASVDARLNHASERIHNRFPGRLKALFSPQHGFHAEKQDNMIESEPFMDPRLKIPVFSLYHQTRKPTRAMMEEIDVLLIDLQDVGTRVYTFVYTISYCLEAARENGKPVIILDRPNPVGGLQIEGNVLSLDCASFVGRFPIPMRHGLTVGEISRLFNQEFGIHCDLAVIPMSNWKRTMYWSDTGRFWIPPSPNLPTPLSCMVYPGQVIFEGTNLSEGRGTTLPFEQVGAPFLDIEAVQAEIADKIEGAVLRPVHFEPTSGKWQGKVCQGFHIHVTDRERYNAYLSSLILLQAIIRRHPEDFRFKLPPYEYEFEKLPMDLILGSRSLRERLSGPDFSMDLPAEWQDGLNGFKTLRERYRLYD